MFKNFTWLNEPAEWQLNDNGLTLVTGNETDFWLKTFYGFEHLDGHFFYTEYAGDFSCEVEIVADFEVLYDQLGLMIRANDQQWIKTGIEYTDGAPHISTVVTREYSDWSMIKPDHYSGSLKLRLTRHDDAVRIQYLDDNDHWVMIRLAHLDLDEGCQIGVMACSPQRAGFKAEFRQFSINEAISRELHE